MHFQRGDLIHASRPFAFVLYPAERARRCDFCFAELELKYLCTGCKYVAFCSRQCQREAKETNVHHLAECRLLSKRPYGMFGRLLGRLLVRLDLIGPQKSKEGQHTTSTMSDPSQRIGDETRHWSDLMDHYDEITHDWGLMRNFIEIYTDLEELFNVTPNESTDVAEGVDSSPLPPYEDLLRIYGKVVINSFAVQNHLMVPIGRAIYIGASIFDHSCEPEASFTFVGTALYVKSVREFSAATIREVHISYLDELETTQDRQAQLAAQFYFDCACIRCTKANSLVNMREHKRLRTLIETMEAYQENDIIPAACELAAWRRNLKELIDRAHFPAINSHVLSLRAIEYITTEEMKTMFNNSHSRLLPMNGYRSESTAEPANWESLSQIVQALRVYYGPCHPRLAVRLLRYALLAGKVLKANGSQEKQSTNELMRLKTNFLQQARRIAEVYLPSPAELLPIYSNSSVPSAPPIRPARGRQMDRSVDQQARSQAHPAATSRFVTLIHVIDKELSQIASDLTSQALVNNLVSKRGRSRDRNNRYHYQEQSREHGQRGWERNSGIRDAHISYGSSWTLNGISSHSSASYLSSPSYGNYPTTAMTRPITGGYRVRTDFSLARPRTSVPGGHLRMESGLTRSRSLQRISLYA